MNGVGPDKNYKFRFVEILENPTHTAPNRARGREGAHLILVGRSRPGRAAACGTGALTSSGMQTFHFLTAQDRATLSNTLVVIMSEGCLQVQLQPTVLEETRRELFSRLTSR